MKRGLYLAVLNYPCQHLMRRYKKTPQSGVQVMEQ
ncbi:MAG: hypothetical protein AWU57_377 [Marinobacter sp. T13-3]|nr:MAG: hypothetical protein AWU57_377 [Marinobacter sp. T13-3]